MIPDRKVEVLLRQCVLGSTEKAADPVSVMTAAVEIHEVARIDWISDLRIVLGIGVQVNATAADISLVRATQKLDQTGTDLEMNFSW